MTTSATIYGTPDQEMTIPIEFEYFLKKFTDTDEEGRWVIHVEQARVNFVRLLGSLEFEPSDITLDLEIAIAEKLGLEPQDVRIDCEVKYKVVKPITVEV